MKIHYGAMKATHTWEDDRLHINLTILREHSKVSTKTKTNPEDPHWDDEWRSRRSFAVSNFTLASLFSVVKQKAKNLRKTFHSKQKKTVVCGEIKNKSWFGLVIEFIWMKLNYEIKSKLKEFFASLILNIFEKFEHFEKNI